MTRRNGSTYRPGERYLLHCVGGVERMAEAAKTPLGIALVPVGCEDALPVHTVPGGEWRLEPEERLVRDWAGRYWSVSAHLIPARSKTAAPRVPAVCRLEFVRYTPAGEPMVYRIPSPRWPAALGDAELVRMLRSAWDSLSTDRAEWLRRMDAAVPQGLEL